MIIDEDTEQIVKVDNIIIHPDFDPETLYNDVCILKLAPSLNLNRIVKRIALPSDEQEFDGTATVSGWGTLREGGESPDVLYALYILSVMLPAGKAMEKAIF